MGTATLIFKKSNRCYRCLNTQSPFIDTDNWQDINISNCGVACSIKQCFKSQLNNLKYDKNSCGGLILIRWKKGNEKIKHCGTIPYPYLHLDMQVESQVNDVLYIGKTENIFSRLARMLSTNKNTNQVAWKIKQLLSDNERAPSRNLTQSDLLDVLNAIEIKYIFEEDPIKRDFGKSFYINKYHPILNIIWEH